MSAGKDSRRLLDGKRKKRWKRCGSLFLLWWSNEGQRNVGGKYPLSVYKAVAAGSETIQLSRNSRGLVVLPQFLMTGSYTVRSLFLVPWTKGWSGRRWPESINGCYFLPLRILAGRRLVALPGKWERRLKILLWKIGAKISSAAKQKKEMKKCCPSWPSPHSYSTTIV